MHAGHRLHVGHDLLLEAGDAAGLNQAQDGDQQRAAPDEDELQYLIKDGRTQTAEAHVDGHRDRRNEDAEADVPAQHDLHHHGHGEHVHAAHQDHFDGEGEGGHAAGAAAVAQVQIAGHRVGLADVIEGHHHQAEEDHGGNGADPVPVRGEDAVLVGGAGPAHQFQRAQVGRNKAQARDPGGHFAPGHEELFAGVRAALEVEADPDDHARSRWR